MWSQLINYRIEPVWGLRAATGLTPNQIPEDACHDIYAMCVCCDMCAICLPIRLANTLSLG